LIDENGPVNNASLEAFYPGCSERYNAKTDSKGIFTVDVPVLKKWLPKQVAFVFSKGGYIDARRTI